MIGTIIGDIVGSRFEKDNIKTKDFELFTKDCRFTDDTVLTVAIADSLLQNYDYETAVKKFGLEYPFAGYGKTFKKWLADEIKGPYNSWGNGSAMRVSPIGYAFDEEEQVLMEAKKSAEITHNHPEGIKGAQAIAMAVFLAHKGQSKQSIKDYIIQKFDYYLDRTLAEIRPYYQFDVSCQGSVPEAIIAFLESTDFEDAIRGAISIGGDSDTIAAMAGSIAEAYYKDIPSEMILQMETYLPTDFPKIIHSFKTKYTRLYSKR